MYINKVLYINYVHYTDCIYVALGGGRRSGAWGRPGSQGLALEPPWPIGLGRWGLG